MRAYPNIDGLAPTTERDEQGIQLLVPLRLRVGEGGSNIELSLFTTLTTFGTPRDVTLDEVSIELFFPADRATEEALRASSTGRLDAGLPQSTE